MNHIILYIYPILIFYDLRIWIDCRLSTVDCITMNCCTRQSLLHLLGSMLLLLLHAQASTATAASLAGCLRQIRQLVIGCYRPSDDTFKSLRA